MNHSDPPAYGLWSLVIINSLVFIIFAGSNYYFCLNGCQNKFEANPSTYVGAPCSHAGAALCALD